jgi:glycosyltransferase involved in cell wall biosynthesis
MQAASGEFITFLDADDVWCPGKVQAQVAYLRQHPQVGCVFGRFRRWELNEQGAFPVAASLMEDVSACSRCEPDRSGWLYTRLLDGLLVGMNTAMIRREVLDKLGGFDETMRIGEDYLFWLKVSRMFEMHSLDAMVALYRIHPASAMRRLDPANHQHDILSVAVARWGLANPDGSVMTPAAFTRRLSECAFTHAYNHFWGGASHVARRWFWVALRGGFLPAKCLVYLALSPVSPWLRRVWG